MSLGVLHNMGPKIEKLHSVDNKSNIQEAWKKLDDVVLDYVMNIMQSQVLMLIIQKK